jgi:predicted RNA-binding protein with PUA domain
LQRGGKLPTEEKTLIIVREPDAITFFFNRDNRRWRIYPHPEKPGWLVIEEYEKGNKMNRRIENALVELNIPKFSDLYEALFRDPEIMIERLIGEKFLIKEVIGYTAREPG